jgi:hypothetical protein
VQQLSPAAPQTLVPDPIGAQLGGMTQIPDEHVPEPLQLSPPFASVHAVVLAPGVQTSQPSLAVEPGE